MYWNAGIRTNPRTGKVSVEFDLPDSITTFRVTADAIGNNGALGVQTAAIRSVEPFYIEPKLPVFATGGDRIQVPVALVNSTDKVLKNVNLSVRANHETIGKT
ncbi:MAG: alpha-2-macroglobulin family protein [Victivallales bacterium]